MLLCVCVGFVVVAFFVARSLLVAVGVIFMFALSATFTIKLLSNNRVATLHKRTFSGCKGTAMTEMDDDDRKEFLEEYEYLPLIVLAAAMIFFYGLIMWVLSSQDKQRAEAFKKGN
jgi:hypothetical protein